MSLEFMITTVEGFEDVAAQEIKELGGYDIEVGSARVFFRGEINLMYRINIKSRCAHKLILVLGRGQALGLSDVYRFAKSINYFDVIKSSQSFAVRTTRVGEHDYTSIDVSAHVGQAIIDNFKEVKGIRPRVDLKNPDVEVDVYVKDSEIVIGINTTGESLHKRNYRIYDHPAALKTTLATCMLRFSGWEGEGLLDPMCGGGTITIEAALMARRFPPGFFRKSMAFTKLSFYDPKVHREEVERALEEANREHFEIYGFDVSPKHIKGALSNASSAGVDDTIQFAIRDCTREETYNDLDVKFVVVNPPYGIRQGRPKALRDLYTKFLKAISQKLSGAILTTIVGCPRIFEMALESVELNVLDSRSVKHGNLPTKVYKIKVS
ncbi:MAG: tRNA (guanine(6)-N2)-methyltransferase [Candidatus Nezhaarchaeales archaeon]